MAMPTAAPFSRYGATVAAFKLGDSNGRGAQNWTTGTNGSRVNPRSSKCLDANRACTADGTS
jgi:hypothetical protein